VIWVIARREATSLFRTPLAWALLCVTEFIIAYRFLTQIELYTEFAEKLRAMPEPPGVSEIIVIPMLGAGAMLLLFVVPVITMATISGERRSGSLSLLYSSPVTSWQIIVGKFLGVLALLAVIWLMIALMPLTLLWGAPIDLGMTACGLFAMGLLITTYAAIGVMFSALFAQPALAAIASFGLLAALWSVDWASRLGRDAGILADVSSLNHFQRLAGGLLDSTAVAYFVAITLTALAIATWSLDGDRRPL